MHSILTDEKRLKQVGLGLFMKGGIRSKKFISYLNNLGHSYDVFLRTGTSWVMELMDASDGYCTIPSNIQRHTTWPLSGFFPVSGVANYLLWIVNKLP